MFEWFTWIEGISFIRQLGFAVAGAGALWSAVFAWRAKANKNRVRRLLYQWVSNRLMWACLYGGLLLGSIGWLVMTTQIPIHAHEGITLEPTLQQISLGLKVSGPWLLGWLLYAIIGPVWRKINARHFFERTKWYAIGHLIFATVVISTTAAWTLIPGADTAFFAFHGFHSILTLGTVLVLDFLFLIMKKSTKLQQILFPIFPYISMVIWVGLGLDFLSVGFVFEQALDITPKLFFSQTVIGILIINGVMLSGPITRQLLSHLRDGMDSLHKKWLLWADVAGTISITSWAAITFVDFFAGLHDAKYHHMIFVYFGIMAMLFLGHYFWERFDKKEPLYGEIV